MIKNGVRVDLPVGETVRDVVTSLPCDGATTLAVIGALGSAGLLDAHVIRLCPTCKGKRYVTGAEDFPGGDEGYDVTCSPCPDCADCPVYVVAPEAMDAAAQAACDAFLDYRHPAPRVKGTVVENFYHNVVSAVLQAILPGTRVAKEVQTCGTYERVTLKVKKPREVVRIPLKVRPGDTIAILEDTVTSCDKED